LGDLEVSPQVTRGLFYSDTIFYVATWGQGFKKYQTATALSYGSATSKKAGFVLSSDLKKSCYVGHSDIPSELTVVPGSTFQIYDLINIDLLIDGTLSLSNFPSPSITDIDDSKLDKKGWCKYYEDEINPLTYATTLTYLSLNASLTTFPLKPVPSVSSVTVGFDTRQVCDGTAPGAFTYSLESSTGGTKPDHVSVDAATGAITISSLAPSGIFRVRLLGVTATTF